MVVVITILHTKLQIPRHRAGIRSNKLIKQTTKRIKGREPGQIKLILWREKNRKRQMHGVLISTLARGLNMGLESLKYS